MGTGEILTHRFGRLGETLAMVRFSHTLFALPFALTGMLLAARGLPEPRVIGWILVAMVGARTSAMTFNRLADRRIDGANPRTSERALPAGRLGPGFAWGVFALSTALVVFAAGQLNALALALSPLALVILCGYSLTKRFTSWTHVFLGLALSGAPLGAWIAVRADIAAVPLLLAAAVLAWTAGFDIIYALQDEKFDRQAGLHSVPARFGAGGGLRIARFFHLLAVILLLATGRAADLGVVYHVGVATVALLLVYEHRLVSPDDLGRMQSAFFRVNVIIGVVVLAATAADLLFSRSA